jgi:MFS family permease
MELLWQTERRRDNSSGAVYNARMPADDEILDLRTPGLAALLAWLVPGLGHWYQRRRGKAILFFLCVYSLFFFGYQQGNWQIVYFRWDQEEWRWAYLAQAGVGLAALPAMIQRPDWREWLPLRWQKVQLPPTAIEVDDLHREYGKRLDIAVAYTIIAGLLNLLTVYDALAGPALYAEERRHLQKTAVLEAT